MFLQEYELYQKILGLIFSLFRILRTCYPLQGSVAASVAEFQMDNRTRRQEKIYATDFNESDRRVIHRTSIGGTTSAARGITNSYYFKSESDDSF